MSGEDGESEYTGRHKLVSEPLYFLLTSPLPYFPRRCVHLRTGWFASLPLRRASWSLAVAQFPDWRSRAWLFFVELRARGAEVSVRASC